MNMKNTSTCTSKRKQPGVILSQNTFYQHEGKQVQMPSYQSSSPLLTGPQW